MTFNGWTMEKIFDFLAKRMRKRQTFTNSNGYEYHFADGSTFRCEFASWKNQTPIQYYINGELVYQGTEY